MAKIEVAEIIWTEPALSDLNAIAEYIALSHFPAAQKMVQNVFSTVERLEQFPESGRVPLELKNLNSLNTRELIVSPCRVFYKIETDRIFILHVMRQEQDLRRFMLQGE